MRSGANSASSPAGRGAAAGSTLVAGRYAVRVNGLDRLIVTKLDVLSGFERIGLVTGYRRADGSPAGMEAVLEPGLEPVVEELPGWSEDLRDCKHIKNLPRNAQAYLGRLANELSVPVTLGFRRPRTVGVCDVAGLAHGSLAEQET